MGNHPVGLRRMTTRTAGRHLPPGPPRGKRGGLGGPSQNLSPPAGWSLPVVLAFDSLYSDHVPMPALVIPPDMAIVTCSGAGGTGDVWNNVFAVDITEGVGTIEDIAADLAPVFLDFYTVLVSAGYYPEGWTLSNINVKGNVIGGISSVDVAESLTVTDTKPAAPPQVAVVISWRTIFAGRSFRGRTYIGPVCSELVTDGGVILPAGRDGLDNEAEALVTALRDLTPSLPLAVWSRKNVSFEQVTGHSVGPYFDTQRRRRSTLRG